SRLRARPWSRSSVMAVTRHPSHLAHRDRQSTVGRATPTWRARSWPRRLLISSLGAQSESTGGTTDGDSSPDPDPGSGDEGDLRTAAADPAVDRGQADRTGRATARAGRTGPAPDAAAGRHVAGALQSRRRALPRGPRRLPAPGERPADPAGGCARRDDPRRPRRHPRAPLHTAGPRTRIADARLLPRRRLR